MSQNPIIIFDGYCNLCSWWVQFILKHDKQKRFKFCALQTPAAEKLLIDYSLPEENKSVVLLDAHNIYFKSTAALKIVKQLEGFWIMLYAFIIVPRFIRDAVYDFIAKNRYRWFGKHETCFIPSHDDYNQFIV